MTLYRLIEHNTTGWGDTTLAISMGATHYGTIIVNDVGVLRKFVIDLTEDELIIAKLKFSHRVSFEVMDENEISLLTLLNYIK